MLTKLNYPQIKHIITAILFVGLTGTHHNMALAENIDQSKSYTGLWLTEDGETVVRISECKDSLCGRIAGFNSNEEDNTNITEQMIKDIKVSCSTDLIGGVIKQGEKWHKGWIIDFETDKKYSLNLQLVKGVLKVRAYEGIEAFGENYLWKRTKNPKISCTDIMGIKN